MKNQRRYFKGRRGREELRQTENDMKRLSLEIGARGKMCNANGKEIARVESLERRVEKGGESKIGNEK